jgi:NAD(P)-dependent dehydrogenase (short-subunit alcohol dehydrogenase family)
MSPTVLITGVNRGIGLATAALFQHNGWTVAGVDRDEPSDQLGSHLEMSRFLRLDLAGADLAEELVPFVAGLGELNALVNNAAVQVDRSLTETTIADWDLVSATNVRGAFLASQAAIASLRASRGAIVNVSSVHAVATSTGLAAYAASKGALVALTRAAALELAPVIRVNAVLPGAIDTPMLQAGIRRWADPHGANGGTEALAARTPLRRVGRPEEVAEAILFLADERRSSFITGQTIIVDGGAIAHLSTE